MATRANSLAVCSCGAKWGDAVRARHSEEMQDLEHAVVAGAILDLKRHYDLGHQLTGRGAGLRDVIERAARTLLHTMNQ